MICCCSGRVSPLVPGAPASIMMGHSHSTLHMSTATNACIGAPPLSSQVRSRPSFSCLWRLDTLRLHRKAVIICPLGFGPLMMRVQLDCDLHPNVGPPVWFAILALVRTHSWVHLTRGFLAVWASGVRTSVALSTAGARQAGRP